ncbi:hypothetical protein GCM10010219_13760 [Streptomyces netropsis]|nr:hypothetical protein GCM10010219_13760 [Streptomyces netropsis]
MTIEPVTGLGSGGALRLHTADAGAFASLCCEDVGDAFSHLPDPGELPEPFKDRLPSGFQ